MPCILFLLRYFIWKRFVVVVDFLFGLFIHSFVWSVNWVWKSTKYSLAVIFVCNVVVIVHFRLYFCTLAFFASAHALFFAFIRIYVICCILSRYYPLWIFFSSSLHVRKRARAWFSLGVFFFLHLLILCLFHHFIGLLSLLVEITHLQVDPVN